MKYFALQKVYLLLICFIKTLNTNITMQYGEPVSLGKPVEGVTLEGVTLLWINISVYNFYIIKT